MHAWARVFSKHRDLIQNNKKAHSNIGATEHDSKYKVRFLRCNDFSAVNITEVAEGGREALDWTYRPTVTRQV